MKSERYKDKVAELNIEYGNPDVSTALSKLKNELATYKRSGKKAVLLIHGYGSTGAGGSIKPAARKLLGESSMRGIVRDHTGGEEWIYNKKKMIGMCKALGAYENRISGNQGITVVILR